MSGPIKWWERVEYLAMPAKEKVAAVERVIAGLEKFKKVNFAGGLPDPEELRAFEAVMAEAREKLLEAWAERLESEVAEK